jgi:P-type E1-E2 ATPase
MLEIQLPGQRVIQLNHVVCDINGTLTVDGQLLDGVKDAIARLKDQLEFHLLSANTTGTATDIAKQLGVDLTVIQPGGEAQQKEHFVTQLGVAQTVAIGQGVNDALMLKKAALGICVISREGSAVKTLTAADLVVPDILSAFELLQKPLRIVASLRQ